MSIDLSLERIRLLLAALGDPQNRLSVIHVAGTNGKGSVTAVIAWILRTGGYSVARFNSPHFLEPRDAFRLNERPVSCDVYDTYRLIVERQAQHMQLDITPFELEAAVAFNLFAASGVDFAVIETGLGGRLDATNVCAQPCLTVITSIGYDHMEFLGDTIDKIAAEKAGIMRRNCPCVVAPQRYKEAQVVLENIAHSLEIPVVFPQPIQPSLSQPGNVEFLFQSEKVTFPMHLHGSFQLENVATALQALDVLQTRGLIRISPTHIESGAANLKWPGRLEYLDIPNGPRILLDGAHNIDAAVALDAFVSSHVRSHDEDPVAWIVSLSSTKNVLSILKAILRSVDTLIAVEFSMPQGMPWVRCMTSETIVEAARHVGVHNTFSAPSLHDAFVAVKGWSHVVVCGSLYLAADIYRYGGFTV